MIKILNRKNVSLDEILKRNEYNIAVSDAVQSIVDDVKANGDAALLTYAKKFDRAEITSLTVDKSEIEKAVATVGDDFMQILTEAAQNIREFHTCQKRNGFSIQRNGAVLGQRVIPLERVGLYVPGGTASYPSSVLMNAIPAKIAGVDNIAIATPPRADGSICPEILAAASVAGVDVIYKMGGAQAVAALAYGTETVKAVDKIVGPGNIYVAEAKKRVWGKVAIDMVAGPSEILVIADGDSDAAYVATDLLSQAEHDKMATAVLITDSETLAYAVRDELEKQLETLPRADIARVSIDESGKIIIVKDIDEAIEISNMLAPEHLELCVNEPFAYLSAVRNAGSVFMGRYTPEAVGDYFAGANHTLPTNGCARFSSPLSVDDFIKTSQYVYYSKQALDADADKINAFAIREGLTAHGLSAISRKNKEDK